VKIGSRLVGRSNFLSNFQVISLVNIDSELKREQRGTGSKRGTVPISRIRKLREGSGCHVYAAPIDMLTEDYIAVLKDKKKKISHVVLRYLLDRRIIKGHLYTVYSGTSTNTEDRFLTQVNVVADVNMKLIEFYESA